MRFLKKGGDAERVSRSLYIGKLLERGVAAGNPYALLNAMLLYLELGKLTFAEEILDQIDPDDLLEAVASFWYPIMWKHRRTAEGALLSLLVSRISGNTLPDEAQMRDVLQAEQPVWAVFLKPH